MKKKAFVQKKIDNNTYYLSCDTNECMGCKSKLFCRQKENLFKGLSQNNDGNNTYQVDECVEIYMDEKKTFFSICIVFVIPLLFMLIGIFISNFYCLQMFFQSIIALLSLVLGMAISALISKKFERYLLPKIIDKISNIKHNLSI